MSANSLSLHIEGFEGFDRSIDFDKSVVRRTMRRAGAPVTRDARRRLAQPGPSQPGDYPARRTGRLQRAIRATVSRSGFMVVIRPRTGTAVPPSDPYFAYLYYGVRRGAMRRRNHRAQPAGPYRIAPRANYMVDALDSQTSAVRRILTAGLADALRIR